MRKQVQILLITAFLGVLTLGGSTVNGAAVQKVTLTMGEYFFRPSTVTLQAGGPVEITLPNKGKIKHEFMVYQIPKAGLSEKQAHAWAEKTSYFKGLDVTVEGKGVEAEREAKDLIEVEVARGGIAVVKFTPKKTGKFEIGCFIEGHYEAGMKGTLIVK